MHSLYTALCSHLVLAIPDYTKPFHIESDAFDTAVGGILMQEHTSIHKPITFLSNTFIRSGQNYSIHGHELLAIITCCKAGRLYIDGL